MQPKYVDLYQKISILFLNTVLLFVLCNVSLWIGGRIDPELQPTPQADPTPNVFFPNLDAGMDVFREIFSGKPDKEIIATFLESWNSGPLICDQNGILREAPFQGTYVNVDPRGFRIGEEQAPWPPIPEAYNIFVFGGSTTFGYGVTDNDTIPSVLQEYLRTLAPAENIAVYNFGHGYYYSSAEKQLFEQMLSDGFFPDLAIFIDGLNDFFHANDPLIVPCQFEEGSAMQRVQNTLTCRHDEVCLPIQRFFDYLSARRRDEVDNTPHEPLAPYQDDEANRAIIERWLENKRAIEAAAAAHNIDLLFVMQPVPAYGYNLSYHPFLGEDDVHTEKYITEYRHVRTRWGYALWNELFEDPTADWTKNVLNLTTLAGSEQRPLYVDVVHYSPYFSEQIARQIGDRLARRFPVDQSFEMGNSVELTFGNLLTLTGFSMLEGYEFEPCHIIPTAMLWTKLEPIDGSYRIVLSLIRESDNQMISTSEQLMVGPTSHIDFADFFFRHPYLDVPCNLPAGLYHVQMALVDAATEQHLPVTNPDGSPRDSTVIHLTTVFIR